MIQTKLKVSDDFISCLFTIKKFLELGICSEDEGEEIINDVTDFMLRYCM